jgi:hypothetical protein
MTRRNCIAWAICCWILVPGHPVFGEALPTRTVPEPAPGKSENGNADDAGHGPKEKADTWVVRHSGPGADGLSVTETRNFRLLHNQSRALAEKAARAAELARTAGQDKWLTEPGPTWEPRCDLYLHATGADFHRLTGLPEITPGVSTTRCDNGRVLSRRIDVRCDAADFIEAVLPHEVTHTVLAGCFTKRRLPPWANEALAVLSEPRSKVQLHLGNLPRYREEEKLFSVRQLVQLEDYPESRRMGPFYAQSVSLVDFLTHEKDPQTTMRFLHDGLRDGYESALQRHYGWDFKELDSRWRRYAFRP